MQEKAYQAIQEIYNGAVPDPYDFNRIDYIKALHIVNILLEICVSYFHGSAGRLPLLLSCPSWISARDARRIDLQWYHHPCWSGKCLLMFLALSFVNNGYLYQLTIMNCYVCNRDPSVYDTPDAFIPERWMNGHRGRTDTATVEVEKIGVPHLTFGAGRRICSGFESTPMDYFLSLADDNSRSDSGKPWYLFGTCPPPPLLYMGACASC